MFYVSGCISEIGVQFHAFNLVMSLEGRAVQERTLRLTGSATDDYRTAENVQKNFKFQLRIPTQPLIILLTNEMKTPAWYFLSIRYIPAVTVSYFFPFSTEEMLIIFL